MSTQNEAQQTEAQRIEDDAKDLWMAAHNQYPKLAEDNMKWSVSNGIIGIRVLGSLEVKGVQFYGFPITESYESMRARLLSAVGTCFNFEAEA